MALAILEFISFDKNHAMFRMDSGTNGFYKFKIGRAVANRNGIDLIDDVVRTTSLQKGQEVGNLLASARDVGLPSSYFDRDNCYIQLFSYKTPEGKSPAFSKVLKIPVGFKLSVRKDYLLSISKTLMAMDSIEFNAPRQTDHSDSAGDYTMQESFVDDLMSGIKIAAPIVMQIMSAIQHDDKSKTNGTAGTTGTDKSPIPAGMINGILNTLLHGFSGGASLNTSMSVPVSDAGESEGDNRFGGDTSVNYSRPFIFGIDDALIGTLAAPLIQKGLEMLPQLLTAMNQKKLQTQAANNKLMTDLVSDTNRRMILQQLLQNQSGAAQNPNIQQLMQILQQAAATAPATPAGTTAPTATTQSLDSEENPEMAVVLSTRGVLTFDQEALLAWNGIKKPVYSSNTPVIINMKLSIPEPAPKNPLPKAIIHFYFKETDSQKSLLEKTFKQKDIAANKSLPFLFTKDEMAALPLNRSLMIYAEMRWLTGSGKEIKVLGTTELVLVNNYFMKEQGKEVSPERELNDMKVYRSFWNKIWEAPVLDASTQKGNGVKKYSWSLDANLKYTCLITSDHDANGLMETKLIKAEGDQESMTDRTEGRMKAGLELSLSELNKLCSLWDKQPLLTEEKLSALKNMVFAKNNTAEAIYHLKLKGKAGERGMVWVIPVFKLVSITLNKIKTANTSGQVTTTEEEIIQFPLPVSARMIGLKST